MAYMYYCSNCNKYYSSNDTARYYISCPNCKKQLCALGVTESEWITKSEEEKTAITNKAVLNNISARYSDGTAMFSNIGGKIKALAKVICWLGIIAAVIAGIVQLAVGATVTGLLTMVFGALGSWVGSFLLYGFGELIDKTTLIAQNTQK